MKIASPLSGILVSLEQVPDEAFASRLVGDGVSIDPLEGLLKSPCDGTIEFIHPAGHALTLKTEADDHILIHIGVDTVSLKGEGFISLVRAGQKVKSGDALIEFDVDFVSASAKSLLTQVLLTNPENYNLKISKSSERSVQVGDEIFSFEKLSAASAVKSVQAISQALSRQFVCHLSSGLHARPAAALVQKAKKYKSDLSVTKNNKSANAKSLVNLLTLEIAQGDHFSVQAQGADAEIALDELTVWLDTELTDEASHAQSQGSLQATQFQAAKKSLPEVSGLYRGVTAAPGLALAKVFVLKRENLKAPIERHQGDIAAENQKLTAALTSAEAELNFLIQQNRKTEQGEIFAAHHEILEDPELFELSQGQIKSGFSAAYAWDLAICELSQKLSSLKNEVMATRAHDLEDIGQRVLRHLLGKVDQAQSIFTPPFSDEAILIARDLTPSDMAHLDSRKIKGIVTVEGGASSHVAILARSKGMAYLVAAPARVLELTSGAEVLLDASCAELRLELSDDERKTYREQMARTEKQKQENSQKAAAAAVTRDGQRIHVFANVGEVEEASDALSLGAEGVGLLRSEFLFLHRNTAPTEQEQLQKYQSVVDALNTPATENTVIIRTLDVGGDKPLSYLPMPAEENPFLGVRGLRLSLRSPELLREQLRALLRVKPQKLLHIMFPMVTTLSELFEAKKILREEYQKLHNTQTEPDVAIGIMIEVPSAALMAESFAPHVDFFSIGSNDLTQYALAIDRGHRELAAMADGLHPSVLRLIHMTCQAAQKYKKMVGVCGGIAGDADAVPLLLGLGVQELSVSVPVIPNIKAQIRELNLKECQSLALQALNLNEALEVRQLVKKVLLGDS